MKLGAFLKRYLVPGCFRVTIVFNGGASETFVCRNLEVIKRGDDFTDLTWTSCVLPRRRLFKIDLTEIAGIFVHWVLF